MQEKIDWYPATKAEERLMYGNVDVKIDGYVVKYPFLNPDYVDDIHTMCRTFVKCYDKMNSRPAFSKNSSSASFIC